MPLNDRPSAYLYVSIEKSENSVWWARKYTVQQAAARKTRFAARRKSCHQGTDKIAARGPIKSTLEKVSRFHATAFQPSCVHCSLILETRSKITGRWTSSEKRRFAGVTIDNAAIKGKNLHRTQVQLCRKLPTNSFEFCRSSLLLHSFHYLLTVGMKKRDRAGHSCKVDLLLEFDLSTVHLHTFAARMQSWPS